MKKIGILTFHRALNYGAVLQTYALTRMIEEITGNRINVEVIDYRCTEIENIRSVSKRFKKFSLKKVPNLVLLLYKKYLFNTFIRNKLKISKKNFNRSNINATNDMYDGFIVGSDQVWNYDLNGNDTTYLLDFIINNKKKISYAASTGLKEIDAEHIDTYSKLINDFHYLSVREKESEQYLRQEININEITTSLDPTLLLSANHWCKLASTKKRKGYILVYNVPKPDYLFELAKQLEKITNLKAVYITTSQRPATSISQLVFPSIEDFLALFRDADYVLTNSFHGTVFSILFHRQFLVERKQGSSSNDRIDTLLSYIGLSNRVSKSTDVNTIFEPVNWQNADTLLEKNREFSLSYLETICLEIMETHD